MKCPYCNHEFPLTWARYLGAPAGRHVCPDCRRVSRFRWTAASWLRQLAMVCAGAVPVGYIFYFWLGAFGDLLGVALGGLLVGLPLDKFYDGNFRKLEKDEPEKIA